MELLVVVIIIGILAAIAIPTFLSQRQRGWQAQLTSDVRNAILDVEAEFVTNNGRYPDPAEVVFTTNSDPVNIRLDYNVNDSRTEFCVLGTHDLLPATANIAHYVSGSGVQIFEARPLSPTH
ncbi:hypothetical protein BH23ACT9_BH23ACT9_19390 [soil metagenome]